MEVGAGRMAGRANHGDRLALGDVVAAMDEDFAGVAVECAVAVAVIDNDVQAVPAGVKGGVDNGAGGGGVNRRGIISANINASMVGTTVVLVNSVAICRPDEFGAGSGCGRWWWRIRDSATG